MTKSDENNKEVGSIKAFQDGTLKNRDSKGHGSCWKKSLKLSNSVLFSLVHVMDH